MQKMDVVATELSTSIVESGFGFMGRARATAERLSDRQLAFAIGAVLFAISAWPVALVDVPPLQDLPNHLAAVTVISHPEQYPEFVANGFFKTNAALFGWLCLVGKVVGVKMAASLFQLLVLALNALVMPQFVLRFTNRRRLVVASLFLWPVIHNWFVSMGMLDFALGVPLSLLLMMAADVQRQRPTWGNGALLALASLATWYAHVFALMAAMMLLFVHVVERRTWRERFVEAFRIFTPALPVIALMSISVVRHLTEPTGAMSGFVQTGKHVPLWELAYNVWAEFSWGFTWLSISTLVPTLLLAWFAFQRRAERITFFSPLAFLTLTLCYLFTPYIATNWFHVNSRFLPFLWMAAFVRLPDRLDRRLVGALGVSAALYSVGMGVDYLRLDADRAKFTAGIAAVPENARLLPLVFKHKETSENTRSLLHAWGHYVVEKRTSAPLLFAHSRSFPVMYREPPPAQFNHLVLESFAPSMGSPYWMCNVLRAGGVHENDCEGAWRREWAEFWDEAKPRFDHVLMWGAPEEAQALVPPEYRIVFRQEKLTIYRRVDAAGRPLRSVRCRRSRCRERAPAIRAGKGRRARRPHRRVTVRSILRPIERAKKAVPLPPVNVLPRAKTSPWSPSCTVSGVMLAVRPRREIFAAATNERARIRTRVRSIPARSAGDGEPDTAARTRWPVASSSSVSSAFPALPMGARAHAGSPLVAWGKARVNAVARSIAPRSPTAP